MGTHPKRQSLSRIPAQGVAQKGPGCDAKVCRTRPSNPLKTLGPEPRLVCFIHKSMEVPVVGTHAKRQSPSRIQAQGAQKGPGCDAKVCLTRPSNPLKTLGLDGGIPVLGTHPKRQSPSPAGFQPKGWPKKVPDATPRCA